MGSRTSRAIGPFTRGRRTPSPADELDSPRKTTSNVVRINHVLIDMGSIGKFFVPARAPDRGIRSQQARVRVG
jgi:hypothetical protein